jgi:hypothetical protein
MVFFPSVGNADASKEGPMNSRPLFPTGGDSSRAERIAEIDRGQMPLAIGPRVGQTLRHLDLLAQFGECLFGKSRGNFGSSSPLQRTGSVTRSWTPRSNNKSASAKRS